MKKILFAAIGVIGTLTGYAQLSRSYLTNAYSQHLTKFGLTQNDISNFVVTSEYTDTHNGITHVYLRQVVNGIEIFNANSSIHFKGQNVVSINNGFIANAVAKTNTADASIGASQAIQTAGADVEISVGGVLSKADLVLSKTNQELVLTDKAVSEEPIKAKLYYVSTPQGLVLAYNVEVFNNETNDWWNIRVDATNGNIIEKNNWTTHCNVSAKTFSNTEKNTQTSSLLAPTKISKKTANAFGSYNVFAFPVESPIHGTRSYVPGSSAKQNASPYGWHDTNAVAGPEFTTTRGNNVFADEDTLASNGLGYSPDGGDSLVFDFPTDTSWMDYKLWMNAGITQLFYANNYLHDVFYQYGFDEVSGNYQFNNYGKGGKQGDYVNADAQDGSGTGNANFSAPVDGSSGRMQMYLWPAEAVAAPKLSIAAPSSAAGSYTAPLSSFGAKRFADISAEVVLVDDGSAADSLGCNTLINGADLEGKIALIYRGTCNLTNKVLNAQNAGAIGVIVIHNSSSNPTAMQGSSSAIKIPSVIVSVSDGAKIKASLNNGDTVIAIIKGLPVVKSYDSDFDNGVMAHEFGHGISIRLTGGPANSSCLNNAEQGGEGWSDFFGLVLTAKPTDKGTDGRGIGTYVFNEDSSGLGIRSYRYSTNMTTNPMTYKYVRNQNEEHYVGSVWCTMLWEMYWGMVDKYGFDEDLFNGTGGNNKAIQLVMDGLKLQPCSPGFVDARDAILKADSINNGGANREIIWRAFAKRGLGFSAKQGLSSSITDGTTTFDLPADLTTGIATVNSLAQYITMMPNPSTGVSMLVMPDQIKEATVIVTDVAGKVVFERNMSTDLNQHIQIDLTAEASGIYFVKALSGATTYQSKIVLAK
jgi:extracellular elastinolytic metalloproteinase